MLLVRATAGPSEIHGIGLIAREFIPEGTVIWRFEEGFDLLLSEDRVEALPEPAREQVIHYAYFHAASRSFVLSSDDDRFTNHSDASNSRMDGDNEIVALRDILPGEEITADYGELYPRGGHRSSEYHFRNIRHAALTAVRN